VHDGTRCVHVRRGSGVRPGGVSTLSGQEDDFPESLKDQHVTVDIHTSDYLVGRTLDGRYRVGSRIARGGMATVYEALDTRLDRVVALKVMNGGLGDDHDFSRKFVHEARAAARLSHPNVVAVFDQGSDDGTLFLAMEYVPGRTLREVIRESAPMSPARALDLLTPILSALSAAHDAGIVHRDIKPENVLIATDGKVKVADFGLSRAVSANGNTATHGLLMGTVSYLAPELVTDGSADARSDVYSAGIVLYEMLTGTKPHSGDTPIQVAYRHVHHDVPPPSQLRPDIPPYVDALVQRATARSRELRPADAHVFAQQVRRVRSALEDGVSDDPELTGDLTVPIMAMREEPEPPGDEHPSGPHLVQGWDGSGYHGGFSRGEIHTDTIIVEHPPPRRQPPAAPPRSGAPQLLPRKRRGPAALIAILVLAVAVGTAAWYYGVQRYTQTPDLTQMTTTQAADKAAQDGLSTTVVRQDYSETVQAGIVLSTDPGIGDRILKHGQVGLIVSRGKERYTIPKLTGMPLDAAKDTLAGLNLRTGSVDKVYDEKVAQGNVVKQSLPPGQVVRRDQVVDLTVSKGKQPIAVPDTTGKRTREARRQLVRLGFQVKVTEEFSESVPQGRVTSQTPNAGTRFAGDTIQLVVSKGPPPVRVPSVWRMPVKDAERILTTAGFKVKTQKAALYIGLGVVGAQNPQGNSMAQRGSTITLTIL
jgi:eukaryotic-like serine/threonine-protein kinase